eukprot:2418845-Ditylum_brightwellii.AAC.1
MSIDIVTADEYYDTRSDGSHSIYNETDFILIVVNVLDKPDKHHSGILVPISTMFGGSKFMSTKHWIWEG